MAAAQEAGAAAEAATVHATPAEAANGGTGTDVPLPEAAAASLAEAAAAEAGDKLGGVAPVAAGAGMPAEPEP